MILFDATVVVIKISIVFALGFLMAYLFRRRSAAVRHFTWAITLCGALAMALLTLVAPRLEWAVLPSNLDGTIVSAPTHSAPSPAVGRTLERVAPPPPTPPSIEAPSPTRHLPVVRLWLAGVVLVILWCAVGHLGLIRLARRAVPLTDERWLSALKEASALSGVTRPVVLLQSAGIASPMTWGCRRPIVLLPAAAEGWTMERRRVVLLHELAHIARLDFVTQLLATLTCALYWFHPGAWTAARRLRHESERACDDCALAAGTPAADYASHLLSLSLQSKTPRWHGAMAIGMARPSTLEARIRAVLDEGLTRRAVSHRVRMAGSVLLGLLVLSLSALAPVRRAGALSKESTLKDDGTVTVVSRSIDAKPGERLDLKLEAGGNVDIQGWNEGRVSVRARLGGSDPDKIRLDVSRVQGGVQVHAYFVGHSQVQSASNDFEIRVPRRFDLRLLSSGGSLKMSDVEGSFHSDSGGGEIILDHVKGEAELSTGGSDIHVTDSDLKGVVSTGGGTVDLVRVSGGLVGSSASGSVSGDDSNEEAQVDALSQNLDELKQNLEDLKRDADKQDPTDLDSDSKVSPGVVSINKSGGAVELREAPQGAVISTGGGDVVIGSTGGTVVANTGGGDMQIGPVSGSLRACTGAGDVRVEVVSAGHEPQTVELSSGSGTVVLELPAAFDGKIELESGYTKSYGRPTRIVSDWNLERESTQVWDDSQGTPRRYIRAHGTLGNGRGHVRITTVNGNIELRRAKPGR